MTAATRVVVTEHARERITARFKNAEAWVVEQVRAAVTDHRLTRHCPDWVRWHEERSGGTKRYVRMNDHGMPAVVVIDTRPDGTLVVVTAVRRNEARYSTRRGKTGRGRTPDAVGRREYNRNRNDWERDDAW